jgi:hypothetical protein
MELGVCQRKGRGNEKWKLGIEKKTKKHNKK